MNAKEELLGKIEQITRWLDGTQIRCATITHEPYGYWNDEDYKPKPHILKLSHTPVELAEFLNSLDFDYDSGYGSQQLFGTVWFTNDIWMDRHEYDGSENWDIHRYPGIPHELHNIHHIDEEPLTELDYWDGDASHSE
jgi:hypothetical protein